MDPSPPTHRGWKDVDRSSDPGWYVRFLERSRRNQIERIAKDPKAELGELRLEPGLRVLDVGCGIGSLTATFVPLVAPGGSVVGLDRSHVMIEEATRRHAGIPASLLRFELGSATEIPEPNASFDRTMCNMVLEHVPVPEAAVREMVRVTRPGGWVVVTDRDTASHIVATGDLAIDRRMIDAFAGEILHPYGVRQVPAMLHALGVGPLRITAETVIVRGEGEQGFLPVLDDFLAAQVAAGRFRPDEADWIRASLRQRLADDTYFESFTHLRIAGRVPTELPPVAREPRR